MTVQPLSDKWAVDRDEHGIWLWENYKAEVPDHPVHLTLEEAERLAGQLMAWQVIPVYEFKDEEGNPVADEIVEGSRD